MALVALLCYEAIIVGILAIAGVAPVADFFSTHLDPLVSD
jgi:hypothetical protein